MVDANSSCREPEWAATWLRLVFVPSMERKMKIKECMTHDVHLVAPDDTLRDAALEMIEIDAGVLPVSQGDRLVGMITDRDIAVRGVALGHDPSTKVCEIMSDEVKYCFADDNVEDVLENMGDIQLRRMPVLDDHKRLVGIVSITDLAAASEERAGATLGEIARPSGLHSQSVYPR